MNGLHQVRTGDRVVFDPTGADDDLLLTVGTIADRQCVCGVGLKPHAHSSRCWPQALVFSVVTSGGEVVDGVTKIRCVIPCEARPIMDSFRAFAEPGLR